MQSNQRPISYSGESKRLIGGKYEPHRHRDPFSDSFVLSSVHKFKRYCCICSIPLFHEYT